MILISLTYFFFLCSEFQLAWSIEQDGINTLALFGMLVFIVIFTVELVCTAIVIAKIFGSPTNAILFAIVIWLFHYAAFSVITRRYWENRGTYMVFILCTFFGNQFAFSMQLFHRVVAEPKTIGKSEFIALYLSGLVYIILNLIVLFLLQWLMPGRLLSRQMVYGKAVKRKGNDGLYFGRPPHFSNFEFGDVGSVEVVRMRHVYTVHLTSEQQVLKNVSMRVYEGEVYVLLGHIGSGKLTLLRVLCGLKYPYSGDVYYMGNDFYTNLKTNRKLVDFRSIENGQVDSLTLEQTVSYHVLLKLDPHNNNRYKSECKKWIDILERYIASRNVRINEMTIGERKLVAVCCAMACDTKLIVLEEPTTYLTPQEAQVFWSIIAMEKSQRAFIIATYSIDEAEAVADRIGILSMGVLEASGTPFFLRAKFSSSVQLVSYR